MTRNDYFHQLIDILGAKHGDHNANALVAWAQAEGGSAWWNPLNTTRYESGSWDYNWAHVKNYPTLRVGLQATASTLEQVNFAAIFGHLKTGSPAKQTLTAVENSDWGTGGLALQVLPYVQQDYWKFAQHAIAPS